MEADDGGRRGAAGGGTVHLSYGEEQMAEYVHQLAADHLVHAWDLAVATGGDTRLDPHLVAEVAAWFAEREHALPGRRRASARAASRTAVRRATCSRRSAATPPGAPTHAGLARFSAAFGRGDVDAIMALMTDDCVFEATGPAPDGARHEGADAVRGVVGAALRRAPASRRSPRRSRSSAATAAVLRWRFELGRTTTASPGHVRGADVLRFRDGKVCEKLSYVKG